MPTTRSTSCVTAFAVALAVLAPVPASAARTGPAEAAPADADRLRDLYARGQAAFDAGSYETAIETFEEAFAIADDPTLLFNISLCYDRLGNYEKSLEYLDRYAERAPREEQAEIERRRSSLQARQERAAREGPKTAASDTEDNGEPLPAPSGSQDAPPSNDRLMSPAAWVFTGIGVAAFGTAIGLGAASLARGNAAECENRGGTTLCTERGADDAKASRSLALGADIAIGIGAVAAIAVIAIVGARAAKRNKASKGVALAPSVGGGGLRWAF
jgi:tetratricopeptide (TPR) repeat protein